MKQVVSTHEGIKLIDVPAPQVQPGHVLVEVEYSFVSSGTELATMRAMESHTSGVASHVASNPSLVGRGAKLLREQGVKRTVSRVAEHLSFISSSEHQIIPVGYSCSGRVVEVGEGVTLFRSGDRVACAGALQATHSEIVSVAENLTNKLPDDSDIKAASSVAVGSIALHAVRRADVRLGEFVVVIGLGLVGLLTVQLLKLSGARIIGFDIDAARVAQAKDLGIDEASDDVASAMKIVDRITKHMGADVALVTASSKSSDPVQMAMDLTRQRGRVVLVGFVGTNIDRDAIQRKEIDLMVSSSYGPGRYDERYEDKGFDYPYSYVRWTEKRNMEEYLRLIRQGRIDIESLVEEFSFDQAVSAYARLSTPKDRPVGVVLKYPVDRTFDEKAKTLVPVTHQKTAQKVSLGVVGAGRFMQRVHLPNLKKMHKAVNLTGMVTRRSDRSVQFANQYQFGYASSSYDDLLNDTETDTVLIATRHNLHAGMVLQGLRAGKNVFVEKPLAMNKAELQQIEGFYANKSDSDKQSILMTGYNRRFSPFIVKLKDALGGRSSPLVMNYQLNSEFLPPDHWMRGEEGGGRNIGEACHIYDLFTFLTDGRTVDVKATSASLLDATHARNENFSATIAFDEGSVGSLTYTTLGSTSYPKEILHVFVDERVYVLTDYLKLESFGPSPTSESSHQQDKGHFDELKAFFRAVERGGEWPIPLWQQLQAMKITLEVERQIWDQRAN